MDTTPDSAHEAAREATEALALAIVEDVELAEEVWESLPPVMHYLVVMRHRELLTRETITGRTLMDVLHPALTRERTDEELDQIIHNVVHDYAQELLGLQ